MKYLSDKALDRLRETSFTPDLAGTRYRLLERIARGGMGVVYAAQDEMLARRVALKVLDVPDRNGALASRLNREALVLARLEHPGTVPVHDVGTLADGRVFYTMKFVEGQRLDKHIQSVRSLADRLRLFLRVCDSVAFAHARGVLHRDLKPSNIMVGAFGEVLVMDWGLAKILRDPHTSEQDPDATIIGAVESGNARDVVGPNMRDVVGADSTSEPLQPATTQVTEATGQGTILGTPGYMSPEQARGQIDHLDQRSDVYSLGAILKFLCTEDAASAKSAQRWRVNKSLNAICSKAMAADAPNRYASAEELAADVSRYLDGLPVTARPDTIIEKLGRFYRRNSVAILLLLAYLIMRVLLLIFFHR